MAEAQSHIWTPHQLSIVEYNRNRAIAGTPEQVRAQLLELADLYWAYAHDVANGTRTAPTFADAVRMHDLIDYAQASFRSQRFIETGTDA